MCHKPVWGIKVGLVGHWKSFVVWTAYCTVTLSLCLSDFLFFLFSFRFSVPSLAMSSNTVEYTKVVVICSPELDKTAFLLNAYRPKNLVQVSPPPFGADHLFRLTMPYLKQQLHIEFWFMHIKTDYSPRRVLAANHLNCMKETALAIGIYDPSNRRSFNTMSSWLKAYRRFCDHRLQLSILAIGDVRTSVISSTTVYGSALQMDAKVYQINPSKLFYRFRLKRTFLASVLLDVYRHNNFYLKSQVVVPSFTFKLLHFFRHIILA